MTAHQPSRTNLLNNRADGVVEVLEALAHVCVSLLNRQRDAEKKTRNNERLPDGAVTGAATPNAANPDRSPMGTHRN